ncbi:MAG: 3-deoxy-manno-octulosonate cytidylyltransferase [Bacteroidota bacterium]
MSKRKIAGVIPARYASTRYPGKPLALLGEKTIIQHVLSQANKSKKLDKVVVATDDKRIYDHVLDSGYEAVMTGEHPSGTDRCLEAITSLKEEFDFVINVQGDEPFIQPNQIDLLAGVLDQETEIASLIKKIDSYDELFNPNVVKAVRSKNLNAIYFSRHPIPFQRGENEKDWHAKHEYYKHLGIYAYRTTTLKKISGLPPSKLEKSEALEQLRWLENGYHIKLAETAFETFGIDTPEDLEKARLYLSSRHSSD